uniref:DUF7507 domain-containing protein n=1 Tax=Sphingobacterium luzhongxinii TaxID=2654181 RepID=UPI0013D9A6DF
YDAVGDVITYTITVTNTGNVTLNNVSVVDAKVGLNETITSLAPGAANAVTYNPTYSILQADLNAGSFVNTATATHNSVSHEASATVTAVQSPDFTITKTADVSTYDAVGDVITYTITVTNTGNVTLNNVSVVDAKVGLNETITSLAPGAANAVTYNPTYSILQADLNAGSFVNTASATHGTASKDASATVTAVQNRSVVVEKVVDQNSITAPGTLNYTITVENKGNVNLSGTSVVDEVVQGDNSTILSGSLVRTGDSESDGVLSVGEKWIYTVSYIVTQSTIDNGKNIVNTFVFNASELESPVSDDATTTIQQNTGISIVKSHNLPTSSDCYGLKIGDKITYTFVVKNTGNVSLSNVTVTDALPRIGAITSTESGNLAPGATRIFTAEYVVDQNDINVGSIRNTASVKGTAPSGAVTGTTEGVVGISSNEVVISICQLGKVAIDKKVNKETISKVGEELIYTIKVTNTGNTDLEEVTVEDLMLGFHEVVNLKVGEVKTYSLTYVVKYADLLKALSDNTASLDNIASATLKTRERVTDDVSTKITFIPEIDIVKSADKSVVTFLGEEVEYIIEVKNTGSVDLVNVVVTDPMFPNFTGNAGNLAVGETKKFELTYVSVLADIIRGEIKNTAQVKGTVAGAVAFRSFNPTTGVIEKLSNEVVIPVLFNSVLEVAKVADKTEVQKVGEVINYSITVANKGQYELKNVQVRDPLTGLNETIATLGIGETVSFNQEKKSRTSYTVVRSDFDNGKIVNVVTATATDLKGGTVSGSAERTVTVVPMPLFIPNVYTPNGDEVNDTFEIVGIEAFDRTEVTILNRWGNEVYRNDNYRNEWSGHGLNEGTYFYIIKTIKGTKEDIYKGHVLIKTR